MSSESQPNSTPNPPTNRPPLTSPPLDPSKLNQNLAPLPPLASSQSPAEPTPNNETDTPYLDSGPVETPSHPTIAETGTLNLTSSREGGGSGQESDATGGPISGQLKRVERKEGDGIVKLGSFGGEGLVAKPVKSEQ
jgi:hypothetical protein